MAVKVTGLPACTVEAVVFNVVVVAASDGWLPGPVNELLAVPPDVDTRPRSLGVEVEEMEVVDGAAPVAVVGGQHRIACMT
jgi:hypothetical protein